MTKVITVVQLGSDLYKAYLTNYNAVNANGTSQTEAVYNLCKQLGLLLFL